MTQQFNTLDVLRLEVGAPPATGPRNLVKNPSGDRGAWGWVTPVAGGSNYLRGLGTYLILSGSPVAGPPTYAETEPEPVTPGHYIAGQIRLETGIGAGAWMRVSIVYYNAAGAILSVSDGTELQGTLATGTRVTHAPATAIPAGATHAAMRVSVRVSSAVPRTLRFYEAHMHTATSAISAASVAYVAPYTYTDILAPALDIKVERAGLALGTLSARIRSATLDPAVDALLRPGNPVRLLARTATGAGVLAATYEPLFVGEVKNASTSYDLLYSDPDKRALISLSAVDSAHRLANLKQPSSVATVSDLRYLVEGASTPFEVNGTSEHVPGAATVVATNENASVLDQIALTRDTRLGHAWVNKAGVLTIRDASSMVATSQATLSESVYNADIDVDYDTARCVNVVTIKRIARDVEGKSIETVFGPYSDDASVKRWGSYAEEFTVVGMADGAIEAHANAILAANANPKVRINKVTIPIATSSSFETAAGTDGIQKRAHLDLYDRVAVTNSRAALNETLRVSSLSHTITPDKWLLEVEFASTAGVAMPSPAPALPEGVQAWPDTAWINLTNIIATGAVAYRRKNGYISVRIQAVAETASGVTYTVSTALPANARPSFNARGACDFSGAPGSIVVQPSGAILVAQTSGANRAAVEGLVVYPAEQ